MARQVDRLMTLPYTKVVRRDTDQPDIYVATIREMSGCMAHGETEAEALAHLAEVQRVWVEEAVESGHPIPRPDIDDDALIV